MSDRVQTDILYIFLHFLVSFILALNIFLLEYSLFISIICRQSARCGLNCILYPLLFFSNWHILLLTLKTAYESCGLSWTLLLCHGRCISHMHSHILFHLALDVLSLSEIDLV